MCSRCLIAMVGASLTAGCVSMLPHPETATSLGAPWRGALAQGDRLEARGAGYRLARPGDTTRYGNDRLVGALKRAARDVDRRFPNTEPLRIGDLSFPHGGQHPRHRSHRSGRDADVVFYVTDLRGRSVPGNGALAFDRFGVAQVSSSDEEGPSEVFLFDEARNWHLVRTLLLDTDTDVQWIFCSSGVKARLLRYAAAHERSSKALTRAAWVLHQPSSGNPHSDHFHIRLACSPRERAFGCYDDGPVWPWLRKATEKPPFYPDPADDAALVAELLDEDADGERLAATESGQ